MRLPVAGRPGIILFGQVEKQGHSMNGAVAEVRMRFLTVFVVLMGGLRVHVVRTMRLRWHHQAGGIGCPFEAREHEPQDKHDENGPIHTA